jgi:uncharacterized protein (DUF924 family)
VIPGSNPGAPASHFEDLLTPISRKYRLKFTLAVKAFMGELNEEFKAMSEQEKVLKFWFEDSEPKDWFTKSDAYDEKVRQVLGPLYEKARDGALDGWAETADGVLALCILLDQVPRNIFRNSAKSFATYPQALALTKAALERGFENDLNQDQKSFLLLPLEHSEDLQDQERSVELFKIHGSDSGYDYAIRHRDIVARFGRFPHRNAVLGRENTEEETEFLKQPGSGF